MNVIHGPAPGEGPARRYGPVERVAVLSDVHANVAALQVVLAEVEAAAVDLVVFCGDLTWGSEPRETLRLVGELGDRAVFIRGNGERAVLELARGDRAAERPRDEWMVRQHPDTAIEVLAGFAFTAIVEVVGLGAVRFCHGSPRSDTELITPATSPERFAELAAGIDELVLVSGHTHLQFDRRVAGRRSINPGSVGLPYHEGEPGTAYWALLGPDVELRQTSYDLGAALASGERVGDPGTETINGLLLRPLTPRRIMDEAETLIFSD